MASSPPALSLVAKALFTAWTQLHPGAPAPSDAAMSLALAWSLGEGAWTNYFQGTNNFGSVHATSSFASTFAQTPGYGMVAFLDHGAPGAYVTRMAVYPTLVAGAAAFLSLVARDVDLTVVSTAADFATGFYVHGYYEGFLKPVTPVAQRAGALAAGTLTSADQGNIAAGASLELEALRRMAASVFGVLMSLEPAMAALAGFLVLGQGLSVRALLGIALVVAASAGAARQARDAPVAV